MALTVRNHCNSVEQFSQLPRAAGVCHIPNSTGLSAIAHSMGIDLHAFQFLRYTLRNCSPTQVITLGRQSLHVPEWKLRGLIDLPSDYRQHAYCEEILQRVFGVESVVSTDHSAYEGATHIFDLNKPLTADLGEYDLVLDAGTLEHVYNLPQAFETASRLCCIGGWIVHILPANNLCGHGFWQFSPELFHSLYSKENGYEETEVFVVDVTQEEIWYQVSRPVDGKRINLRSFNPIYVMCKTKRADNRQAYYDVQQSDYIHAWNANLSSPPALSSHVPRYSMLLNSFRRSWPANLIRELRQKLYEYKNNTRFRLHAREGELTRVFIQNAVEPKS